MKKIAPWLLLAALSIFLCYYFLFRAQVQLGGDIVEYYGITESVKNHFSFELTVEDRTNLEQVLHKAYFEDPGYYISGTDQKRYPVHFIFYSLLALPFRLLLEALNLNPLRSLWLLNIFSYLTMIGIIWAKYIHKSGHRIAFLLLTFISPLMSFFIWPGPDLFVITLLTVSLFAFAKKEYLFAILLSTVASWHSQPVLIVTFFFLLSYVVIGHTQQKKFAITTKILATAFGVGLLSLIPYLYNYLAFGVLTPWTLLQDGWTTVRGFGLHNASVQKFYEQFFDLNIGIFWYSPILFIASLFYFMRNHTKNTLLNYFYLAIFCLTLLFYQTNPGWHYGTSGFGPGRHSIIVLALLFFITTQLIASQTKKFTIGFIAFLLVIQGSILSKNNFLEPKLENTLHNSFFASFILDSLPELYNPTPEIFVDRTNHTDNTQLESAYYMKDGICKKAFVLYSDLPFLKEHCPNNAKLSATLMFEDPFKRSASYPRTIILDEATFWPEPRACDNNFKHQYFVCPKTTDDFMSETGISDELRITTLAEFPSPGIWKLSKGAPIKVTVPPGYILDYTATDGIYVNF